MDEETIKQAVSAKQATREKSRLHLLMTAWEIEEAERHQTLLSLLQWKNAREYVEASNEAHMFERFMTHRHANQLEDDFDFGVGTYDEELLEFSISEEQLNQLEAFAIDHNLHDSNQTITKDKYSTDPFINSAELEDDDESCCDDISEIFQLSDHASQETIKGKAEIKANTEIPRVHREEPMWQYRQRSDWTGHRASGSAIQTGYTASSRSPPSTKAAQCTIDGRSIDGTVCAIPAAGAPTYVQYDVPPTDEPSWPGHDGWCIDNVPSSIPPSNQQSMAGTSAIPPAQFEQRMPSQSATPFQYQSRIQAPTLNVEGIHQAVDNYRPGLRMQADHSDALLRVPSVRAASRAAPYEAYRLIMAYAKPRPGELVRGEEFSTGVIRVVPGSSRAVRKPVHLRLPPVEPAGTGHIAQPGLGSPAMTDQPLMSNSTQPPPLSSATISRIVDSARNAFKRDFLNNLMVASNDLKDMALRAFNQGVEMHSSPSTMNSVDAWVAGSQKTEVKKLKTIPNSIRSIFKDVGQSAVDFALPISERNKELVHQQVYIDSLCIGFAYLDDPDTNAAFRNPALFRIINCVLLEKRLSRWIDPNKRDHDNIIAFSGTILLWALQEHAKGAAGKSEFVEEDNRAAFDSIVQHLNDLSPSERAAVDKLVDDILAEMQ
ncbi:hypothetical protein DFJ58DRAFT_837503 [Suillus subalutaceus]|uniref:uncharacterized protein n=1 Tax=Suillus subalutaceus TaxID=48586 RepID=UPI001B86E219|nr:uncharacterized protein DFJ58DRAFT_837503 [Suillus subalutaceus]KAG1870110.1 hypothetical protein DFJ58DRAFT_837503 [Suillus subalutaceus]